MQGERQRLGEKHWPRLQEWFDAERQTHKNLSVAKFRNHVVQKMLKEEPKKLFQLLGCRIKDLPTVGAWNKWIKVRDSQFLAARKTPADNDNDDADNPTAPAAKTQPNGDTDNATAAAMTWPTAATINTKTWSRTATASTAKAVEDTATNCATASATHSQPVDMNKIISYVCGHMLHQDFVEYVETEWPHYQGYDICPTCITGHLCLTDFILANKRLADTLEHKFSNASPKLSWPDNLRTFRLSLLQEKITMPEHLKKCPDYLHFILGSVSFRHLFLEGDATILQNSFPWAFKVFWVAGALNVLACVLAQCDKESIKKRFPFHL